MPSLQCPDCGESHAIETVAGAAAFRCRGCGRALRVPERFVTPQSPARPLVPGGPGGPVEATRAPGATPPVPSTGGGLLSGGVRSDAHVPLWARLLIWVVAIPLGALIVFGVAQALGILTSRQLLDTFLTSGVDRFGAVARLVPFWALASATIVHLAVLGIARWLSERDLRSVTVSAADAGQAPPARERERATS